MDDSAEMIDVLDDEKLFPIMVAAGIVSKDAGRKERRAALVKARTKLRGRVLWPKNEIEQQLRSRAA